MGILSWLRGHPSRPSKADINQVLSRLVPPVPAPSDEEVRERWLRENTEVHARHIHFRVTDQDTSARRKGVRSLAEAVRVRANDGEDFVELACTFTMEPGGKGRRGDLGFFRRGRMVPQFETAAFALEPGEISRVVETPFGYHIIRVEDRRYGDMRDMPAFRSLCVERAQRNAERKYVEQLKAAACVEVRPGAEEAVRELARQPNVRVSLWTAMRTLVRYRGGRVTVADMAVILRSEPNVRNIAKIATASDALVNDFLSDQAARNLVWAAGQRTVSYRGASRWAKSGATHTRVASAAPGAGLLWFAEFFYSCKDADEVLRPVVEDMRREYFDEYLAGNVAKAKWVRVRGTLAFAQTACNMSPLGKALAWIADLLRG